MGYIKTIKEAEQLLATQQPFNAGTLTASWEQIRYIVRSYGVEIADYEGKLVHPEAYQHSKTTSKHANIVKRAWGLTK